MNYFNKEKKFNNKNFILMGSDFEELTTKADAIVSEAVELYPESFSGERAYFQFELRYTPPFEKSFLEIKRLQGTAAQKAGRRRDFRGYIVIDVSSFLGHEEENYFDITLKFLSDSNDVWNYIFILNNTNSKKAMLLAGKILSILHCRVLEDKGASAEKKKLQAVMKEANVQCTKECADMLLESNLPQEVIRSILFDIGETCDTVGVNDICEYLYEDESTVKYMLSENQIRDIILLCERERVNEKI